MKNILILILGILLATIFTGCDKTDGGGSSNGLTLKQIRTAVENAGYETENGHTFGLYSEVVDGFTLHVYDCGNTYIYAPILECKDEKAAIAVAERETASGYNLPVRNGKFLSLYSSPEHGVCTEEEKAVLIEVLKATPPPPNYSN
jgi:hypothetical protein